MVLQPEVGRNASGGELGMREEPKDAQAITDRDDHYRASRRQARAMIVGFETPATLVAATMQPHHHGQLALLCGWCGRQARRPYVQVQAVLTEGRVAELAGRHTESRADTSIPVGVVAVLETARGISRSRLLSTACLRRLRRRPTQRTHWRCGIRNTFEYRYARHDRVDGTNEAFPRCRHV